MARTLYELAGNDPALRFSPYCWRIRFALAHKDLAVDTLPWYFTDKQAIEFSGQGRVPVLIDGERVVHESFEIATYLEEEYSDHPPLFPSGSTAEARFINAWTDSIIHPYLSRMVVSDIIKILRPEDQHYFRQSRETLFGRKLEDVTANRDETVLEFRRALQPVRIVLKAQEWLGGEQPSYADYILGGSLMWARCVSRFEILEDSDIVAVWFAKLRGLYDDMGETAPRA
ncbi:MAG: glutathione S-transferase family protein [Acetobacteraceae bacterium]|nr:glutathione S-transferase family protein [Acetobacteraceae bacterium]